MKITRVSALFLTAIIVWTAGCQSTPPPKPIATLTINDKTEFTKEISATVTADQKIIMDGKKYEVADIPQQLALRKVGQYITIMVYPESKLTRETLTEMVNVMVSNNYFVAMGNDSRYADIAIPPPPKTQK
ncbi:MAG: hypothetical protein PHP98_05625 [Kiritimatiellae bacterium]|nr:hypothetical protein [Kiritimatiellia bacterium]